MSQITISSGWTRPENYFSQPDGEYRLTLQGIGATDDRGTFTPGLTYEHNGMYGLKVKQSWRFMLDNGEVIEAGVTAPKDGRIHPNSTYYGYVCALVGKQAGAGVSFEEDALIGLSAMGLIQRDDNDIPRITNLRAAPQTAAVAPQVAGTQAAPKPAAEPVATQEVATPTPAAVGTPLREQVAPDLSGNLPF